MKKEVEIGLLSLISIVILIIVIGFIKYANDANIKINNLEKEIVKYQDKITQLDNANNKDEQAKYEYSCNFTKTYRIVNLLEGYKYEVPEYSYIVVDQFQNHIAESLKIPVSLKEELKVNKWYEITYYLKGISNEIVDINYINNSLGSNDSFTITMKIKETNKEGLDQLNQTVCSYERIITK